MHLAMKQNQPNGNHKNVTFKTVKTKFEEENVHHFHVTCHIQLDLFIQEKMMLSKLHSLRIGKEICFMLAGLGLRGNWETRPVLHARETP